MKNLNSINIFIKKIISLSNKNNKNILLPEGNNIKIILAASICSKYNIANCTLIGSKNKIYNIIKHYKIEFNENNFKIINPEKIRNKYIDKYIELRKHKGMTKEIAKKDLKKNIILSTLMLKYSEADGLVAGIDNTTSDTIRPALQLIKIKKKYSLISSLFFMLFKNKVFMYSDCAININPNANQLAEIAIQSAETAIKFKIIPKIAMLSYSTGNSGSGIDIEKVFNATEIVKKKKPNLIIDGPLQYDAAVSSEVLSKKKPNSVLFGGANIFIFPDLNSGNITYKAVQRTSEIVSIGPILQGINKPVNDLSRGASLEEILYTIALTSMQ
ncbi:phosphate acetyltransferase [Candidatus Annandia pinicola]|uniref:phosphate acetyltransferase n=1 Tax=Candidatus Annandia pinicola TaxID=1345117 RepID=UPI001D010082|nr:phosphate acetyltransferase [Candidatus Annandia pinicola]